MNDCWVSVVSCPIESELSGSAYSRAITAANVQVLCIHLTYLFHIQPLFNACCVIYLVQRDKLKSGML